MKETKKQNILLHNPVFLLGVLLVVILGLVFCDSFFVGHHGDESLADTSCHLTAIAGIVTTPSFLFFMMVLFVIFSIDHVSSSDHNDRNLGSSFFLFSSLLIAKIFDPILRAFRKGILNPRLYNLSLVTD